MACIFWLSHSMLRLPSAAERFCHFLQRASNVMDRNGQSSRSRRPASKAILQFINIAQPQDASKRENIALIRSHAATSRQTRARRDRLTLLDIRQYRAQAPALRNGHGDECSVEDRDGQGHHTVCRPDQCKPSQQCQTPSQCQTLHLPSDLWAWVPAIRDGLTSIRNNPFQKHARALSETERRLIDHCK